MMRGTFEVVNFVATTRRWLDRSNPRDAGEATPAGCSPPHNIFFQFKHDAKTHRAFSRKKVWRRAIPEKAEQAAKRKTERKPLRFPYMVEDKMKKMKNCYLQLL